MKGIKYELILEYLFSRAFNKEKPYYKTRFANAELIEISPSTSPTLSLMPYLIFNI